MKLIKLSLILLCLSASALTLAENVTQPQSSSAPVATGSRYDHEAQQRDDNCSLATMWFTYNRFFDSACPWSKERTAVADTLRDTFKRRCTNTAVGYWGMRNRLNLTNRLEDEASDAHLSTQDYCLQITPGFVRLGKTTDHNLKFGTSQKSDATAAEDVLKVPAKTRPAPTKNVPPPPSYN